MPATAKTPITDLVPIISSRIFIPEHKVDRDRLHHYEIPLYNEESCARCQIFKNGERHSADCDECPQYKGIIQLWQEKTYKGNNYIAVPPGQPDRVERRLRVDLSKAIDRRPIIKFTHDIKFIGELHHGQTTKQGRHTVDQVKLVAEWLRHKNGIIECPPRGGKTVTAAYIVCEMGLKTVIIAHEGHLLKQFYRTFRGSRKYPAFTNVKKLARESDPPIIKIINKMSDFTPDLDIALVNYQKFIRASGADRVRKYINDHFSLVVVDEVHSGGALQYAKFIARLNCRHRLGLSATVDRKDGRSRIVKDYMGRTVARSTTTAMIPQIELVETSVTPRYEYKSWPYAMRFLAQNKDRERLILREVFKDLRAGHTIIIPVNLVAHGKELTRLINQQADYRRANKREDWPEETAVFYSNQIRNPDDLKHILDRVDRGKHRVLVPIIQKVKVGIDLSTPTMLYSIIPTSGSSRVNEEGQTIGAPMFYQLSHRVSTWAAGKQQPVVKIFIDNLGPSLGCFKSLFWKEIWPNLRKQGKRDPRYKMDKAEITRAMQISKMREYEPPGKPGERVHSADLIETASKIVKPAGKGFIGILRN